MFSVGKLNSVMPSSGHSITGGLLVMYHRMVQLRMESSKREAKASEKGNGQSFG